MLSFLIGLLGHISQVLHAKKEILPLASQNPASVSVLRGDATCLGRCCEGKETFFELFKLEILSFTTAKTNLPPWKSQDLCFAHTAQALEDVGITAPWYKPDFMAKSPQCEVQ